MSGKVRNLLFETFHVLASYAGKRSKAKLRMPNTLINGFGFEQPTYVHNKTDGTLLFEKAPAPDKILKSWGTPFQAWIKYPGETKQVEKVLETNMNKAKDKLLAGD